MFFIHNLSAAYSELSLSIPTVGMKIDPEREPLAMDPFVSLGMKVE